MGKTKMDRSVPTISSKLSDRPVPTLRSKLSSLTEFIGGLDEWTKIGLEKLPFKDLIKLQHLRHISALSTAIIKRYVRNYTYNFGGRGYTFTKDDFVLITGMEIDETIPSLPDRSEGAFLSRLFPKKGGIKENELLWKLNNVEDAADRLRLAFLYIIAVYINPKNNCTIDVGYIHLIEDLDKFNSFSWGRHIYNIIENGVASCMKILIGDVLGRGKAKKKDEKEQAGRPRLAYTMYFPMPWLQAWLYECVSKVKLKYVICENVDSSLRFLKWNVLEHDFKGKKLYSKESEFARVLDNEHLKTLLLSVDTAFKAWVNKKSEKGEKDFIDRSTKFAQFHWDGEGIRGFLNDIPTDWKYLYIILNSEGIYLALARVCKQDHAIHVYDTLWDSTEKYRDLLRVLKHFLPICLCALEQDTIKTEFKLSVSLDTPKQKNGCDCGVFVCAFLEALTRDASIKTLKLAPDQWRLQMAWEIASHSSFTWE